MHQSGSLLEVFKPALWLVVVSFLIGFAAVLALSGPAAIGGGDEQVELAAALQAARQTPRGS